MFDKNYYPDDITTALINCGSNQYTPEQVKQIVDALYQLQAIAENPYNSDYYRVFYRLLEDITETHLYDN